MMEFTFEEKNLMCIYNAGGTRTDMIAALEEMRGYLDATETELMALTDSTLEKLRGMEDEAFAALELVPEFEEEMTTS